MIYGSVCSGIEAATVAWELLGWRPAFFSEIDKFPRAILKHHYPNVPLHGDFTTIQDGDYEPIGLLVGGTPCQSFSVAGKRLGLDDPRGNLAIEFLGLARRLRPRWLVFENVPGLLSSDGGRDFGVFLRLLADCGYGFAYRVLDAQYVRVDGLERAVPQRRRRVFVVGYLGDWRPPAGVLFEPESLSGHPAPRREPGQGVARPLASCTPGGSGYRNDADTAENLIAFGGNDTRGPVQVATARNAHSSPHGRLDFESETFVAHPLLGKGNDSHRGTPLVPVVAGTLGKDHGNVRADQAWSDRLVPVAFSCKDHGADAVDTSPTLRALGHDKSHANAGGQVAVAFAQNSRSETRLIGGDSAVTGAVSADWGVQQQSYVADAWAVRRLTPLECERLQGLPDGYTRVPYRNKPASKCPDGPRYKAIGNSMAVNCMRWIGQRIELMNGVLNEIERRAA